MAKTQVQMKDGEIWLKTCTKCGKFQQTYNFGPDPRSRTGLSSWCNKCIAKHAAERRKTITDEERQLRNAKCSVYSKKYRAQNPEKSKATGRRQAARYRKRHKDAVAARGKLSPRRPPGRHTREIVFGILGDQCLACGSTENITIDHVQSLLTDVDNSIANLQVLCKSCNTRKGTTDKDYRTEDQKEQLRWMCYPKSGLD